MARDAAAEMLPDPALTFTIPSLHDGTLLDCRVYHPASLAAADPRAPPWRRHAAMVAHPYAPMGGCFDDAVVEAVAGQLLRGGYLVGTFNFRGAGHSAGRTSWTARPERDDYASFVGFMVYYVHCLDPFGSDGGGDDDDDDDGGDDNNERRRPPVLLMSGYSYGAMVTAQLGPLEALLAPLEAPAADSDAAEIRLRAEHLAEQQNAMLGGMRSAATLKEMPTAAGLSPSRRGGVRVGGDEGSGRALRRSHESLGRANCGSPLHAHAGDKLRRRISDLRANKGGRRARHESLHHHQQCAADGSDSPGGGSSPCSPATATTTKPKTTTTLPVLADLVVPRPAYMLVSPLQGLVTHLATMSLVPSLATGRHRQRAQPSKAVAEAKLVRNPTLAVYGDRDGFVPASKLRAWGGRLAAAQGSRFRGREVASAGHFWAEEGVLAEMRAAAAGFAAELVAEDGTAADRRIHSFPVFALGTDSPVLL